MKVSTKIMVGAGLCAVLVVAVLVYHVALVRRLATANQELSATKFLTAMMVVEQLRTIDEMDEHASKLVVTKDLAYAGRFVELGRRFADRLASLQKLGLTQRERGHLGRLAAQWTALPVASASATRVSDILTASAPEQTLAAWTQHFEELRVSAVQLLEATEGAIAEQVARSAAETRRAEQVSWTVAWGALGITLLLGWFVVRSISRPLTRFAEATQAVSEGRFSHEIPAIGRDEFSRLAEEFNQMARRLAEVDQMKKEILSHVSHELKTPLVAMLETNRLLLDEISGPLNVKQRRLLELTVESGQRLGGMMSKLLDLSRIDARGIHYEIVSTDMDVLVQRVLARFEAPARERDVGLRYRVDRTPAPAECDQERLTQVVENLLENALRFAPPGSSVDVQLSTGSGVPTALPPAWQRRGSFLAKNVIVLSVADQGPGVPHDQKRRIFEKFHQVTGQPASRTKGIGLGLAICHEIVEAHRGAIWVEDNQPSGSVFYLVLPEHAPVRRLADHHDVEDDYPSREGLDAPARVGPSGSHGMRVGG